MAGGDSAARRPSGSLRKGLLSHSAQPNIRAQLHALLWKQSVVYRRAVGVPCCMILCLPILVGLVCFMAVDAPDSSASPLPTTGPMFGSGPDVHSAFAARASAGQVLRYAPATTHVDAIMAHVVSGSGGAFHVGGDTPNVIGYATVADMAEATVAGLASQPTWACIQFSMSAPSQGMPGHVQYAIGYNGTHAYSGTWFGGDLREVLDAVPAQSSLDNVGLQLALDASIATVASPANPSPPASASTFQMSIIPFPRAMPLVHGQSGWRVMSIVGSLAAVVALACCGLVAMRAVSNEKVAGLVASMRFMGMNEWVYWSSWHLPIFVSALAAALITPAVGTAVGASAFRNCDYLIWVAILLPAYLSTSALAMALVAGTTSRLLAAVAGAAFFFVTVIFHAVMVLLDAVTVHRAASSYGPSYWDGVYGPGVDILVKVFLNLLPVFHVGKVWDDVLKHTGPQPSGRLNATATFSIASGDWWKSNEYITDGTLWSAPSTGFSVAIMWVLYLVFIFLSWHRGRPAAGEGSSCAARMKHECVCCGPALWARCCTKTPRQRSKSSRSRPLSTRSDATAESFVEMEELGSGGATALDAASKAQEASKADGSIRLVKLTKAYVAQRLLWSLARAQSRFAWVVVCRLVCLTQVWNWHGGEGVVAYHDAGRGVLPAGSQRCAGIAFLRKLPTPTLTVARCRRCRQDDDNEMPLWTNALVLW